MVVRRIGGTVLGIVLANLFIFGWEWLGYQLPLGARALTPEDIAMPGVVAAIALPAQLWVVGGWLLGSFLGALLAFRIARWDFAGWIVGALVAAAGIANILIIAHPFWMALCAVALPFIGALLAFGASRRWRAADLHLANRTR